MSHWRQHWEVAAWELLHQGTGQREMLIFFFKAEFSEAGKWSLGIFMLRQQKLSEGLRSPACVHVLHPFLLPNMIHCEYVPVCQQKAPAWAPSQKKKKRSALISERGQFWGPELWGVLNWYFYCCGTGIPERLFMTLGTELRIDRPSVLLLLTATPISATPRWGTVKKWENHSAAFYSHMDASETRTCFSLLSVSIVLLREVC